MPENKEDKYELPFLYEDQAEIPATEVQEDLTFDTRTASRQYWLADYALKRVFSNQNYIIIFTGGTGTGKTYDAIALAHDIDPNFNADRIVFDPIDFLEVSRSGLPPGSVIIWDEAGVGISAREWFSIQNRVISYVLETFRRDNLILIMTTPHMGFIDSKVRALLHGYAETIDPTMYGKREFGWVKYFHITTSSRSGTTMFIYPRIKTPEGRVLALRGKSASEGNIKFELPPEFITEPYEAKKKLFVERLKGSAIDELTIGKSGGKLGINDLIELMRDNPGKWGFYEPDISSHLLANRIKGMLTIENPALKISDGDIKTAIGMVQRLYNFDMAQQKAILIVKEIPTIQILLKRYNDLAPVANYYGVTPYELNKSIEEWKQKGIWDNPPEEVTGDPNL